MSKKMKNTMYVKVTVYMMASFLLGGVCGYQYHDYAVARDIRHVLGMDDKTLSKKMDDFFDYKADKK